MFKLMGKEINAILGAQVILIWTYVLLMPMQPLINILYIHVSFFPIDTPFSKSSVDPDQLVTLEPS